MKKLFTRDTFIAFLLALLVIGLVIMTADDEEDSRLFGMGNQIRHSVC